jgi:Transglycosylase-like domain
MRRHLAAACVLALAFAAGALAPTSFAEDEAPTKQTLATTTSPPAYIGRYLLAEIDKARREVWRWERLMRVRRTKPSRAAQLTQEPDQRRAILNFWRRKAGARKRQAYGLPRMTAWLCIHRYERHASQGWRTNTGNGFYGGLQMDISFQRAYGPDLLRSKGTADRWLPIEQIWVAERAYRSGRGFYPWPSTARSCGLM